MTSVDYSPLVRALAQLEKSLGYYESEMSKNDQDLREQFRAATIQAFEYTYELSHKLLRRHLKTIWPNPGEIDEMSFQTLIRTGWSQGLLRSSWDRWRAYRTARGTTSHTYAETKAEEVVSIVPDFLEEVRHLLRELQNRQGEPTNERRD